MKTVIFDFDGTIADSFPFTFEAVRELAPKYGYEPLTVEEIEVLREMSFRDIVKRYHLGPIKLIRMTLDAHAVSARRMSETKIFPGMKETLEKLRQSGYRLVIMSSNSRRNIETFLEDNNLDVFDSIDTTLSLSGKGRKLLRIMRRLGLSAANVIYVGDEVRDYEAAREAGIAAINVTWGYNKPEILTKSNKNLADTPAELLALITKSFE